MACANEALFGKYWDENMKALGMWVPSSSMDAFGGITGMISAVAAFVELNPMVSLSAAFRGVSASTLAMYAGSAYASAWCGAAIGSFAVASGRSISCGTSLADVLWYARHDFKIYGSWLETELVRNPQILGGK